jgi:transcriptional regulator with XRE-family HTH domain
MNLLGQLGARLKQLRSELQLRAADVASLVDVTPQYLHALERGEYNPSMELLDHLSVAYQVDVADFFAFPARGKLRHQARELIRFTPNAKLSAVVAALETAAGTTYEEIEQHSAPKLKATSSR